MIARALIWLFVVGVTVFYAWTGVAKLGFPAWQGVTTGTLVFLGPAHFVPRRPARHP